MNADQVWWAVLAVLAILVSVLIVFAYMQIGNHGIEVR